MSVREDSHPPAEQPGHAVRRPSLLSSPTELLDRLAEAVIACDPDWRCTFVNPAAERMARKSSAELMGQVLWNVFPDAVGSVSYRELHTALAEQKARYWEDYYEPLSLWFEGKAYPSPEGVVVFVSDISRRKEAESELKRTAERLRLAEKAAGTAHWSWDLRTGQTEWSENLRELFGFTPDEPQTYDTWTNHLPPEDRLKGEAEFREALQGSGEFALEHRSIDSHGRERWIFSRGKIERDAEGQPFRTVGVSIDITARKRSEDLARRQLVELELIYRTAPVGLAFVDTELRYVRINEHLAALNGLPVEAHLGRAIEEVLPDLAQAVLPHYQSVFATGEPVLNVEIRGHTHASAEEREFRVSYYPVRDEGSVLGVTAVVQDITYEKRFQNALRNSERLYSTLTEALPAIVWATDADGRHTYFNSRWAAYTGETSDGFSNWQLVRFIHREDARRFAVRWSECVASGTDFEAEFRLRGKDGYRWFLARAVPFRNAAGEVKQWLGTLVDVHDSKEAQQKIESGLTLLESIIEGTPDPIFVKDLRGRMVIVNSANARLFNMHRTEMAGLTDYELLPEEFIPPILEVDRRVMATGQTEVVEEKILTRGDVRVYLSTKSAWRDPDGNIVGIIGVARDITDRKRMEDALHQANQALRRANDNLGQFAYIAAHDLQEPLRNIITFSQLIARRFKPKLDEKDFEYLGYVIDGAHRMSQLIADLLAYSRATTSADLVERPVELEAVLQGSMNGLSGRIAETEATIEHSPLPVVRGDAAQLTQLFQNLLSNALKYRKAGEPPRIAVNCQRNGSMWVVSVSDNGQGFQQEYAEQIFRIFKRLHGRDVSGSGIGLAICKSVVERHGGTIWAVGRQGEGSTFYFTLPVAPSEPEV